MMMSKLIGFIIFIFASILYAGYSWDYWEAADGQTYSFPGKNTFKFAVDNNTIKKVEMNIVLKKIDLPLVLQDSDISEDSKVFIWNNYGDKEILKVELQKCNDGTERCLCCITIENKQVGSATYQTKPDCPSTRSASSVQATQGPTIQEPGLRSYKEPHILDVRGKQI